MFHASILQIQEELHYHQQQQEKLEQQLYTLKSYEEFAGEAFDNVRDTIEQIEDPKCLELFKESLLSLFPEQPIYLEKEPDLDDIEYMDDSHPDYKSIEQLQEEELDTVVAVFHSEQHLKEQNIKHSSPKNEEPEKTYYELTGRPDLGPTAYDDIAPNITYSSDGRAYIGFNDKQEAEKFRESIEIPSLLDEAQIMINHKWELKFYCDREYLEELQQELEDDWDEWTPEQKEQLEFQESLIRIAPDIFYQPKNNVCYVGFSNKNRANTYGALLKEVHEVTTDYCVASPYVVTNCKYELRFMCSLENAKRLAPLNLKKEIDHRVNKAVTDTWVLPLEKEDTKEDVLVLASQEGADCPAPLVGDAPLASSDKLDFPAPPYKSIPLSEVELADIVTTSPNAQSAYEVTANLGDHLLATCLYNHSLKHREGQKDFWIKEAYLVQKGNEVPIAASPTRRVAAHSVHRSAS